MTSLDCQNQILFVVKQSGCMNCSPCIRSWDHRACITCTPLEQ